MPRLGRGRDTLRLFPSIAYCIILRVISARALKNGASSLRLDLAKEVNRHFLENERGDLSFFSVVLNWVVNFSMQNKYGLILSVEQEVIVGNVNLASNHGTIYKDLYGINKVLSLLNERGDLPFLFPNLSSYNTNNQ